MGLRDWALANSVIIATLAVLVVIILLSSNMFSSGLRNPVISFKEEPLRKNAEFQLKPGEQYVYTYLFNNTGANITYAIYAGDGCTIIATPENLNSTPSCVGKDGTDSGGYNSTLSDPGIIMFKPWMLALAEGWAWNNSMYLSYQGGETYISGTSYRVIRSDTYMGRPVFLVEVKSSTGPVDYEWIDAEKRIVLRESGEGYDVRLVQGLPLNGSG